MSVATENQADVIVIGAGVVGMCAAWYLQSAGLQVMIVDQDQPGAATSYGNCGMISPSHVLPNTLPGLPWKAFKWMFQKAAPFKVVPQANMDFVSWMYGFWKRCSREQVEATAPALAAILASSRQLFHTMINSEQMDVEYGQSGCIYVYSTQQAFDAEGAWGQVYRDNGVHVDTYDAAALARKEPSLKADVLYGGYHFPNDANLRPDRYVAELLRVIKAKGVDVRAGVKVEGIHENEHGIAVYTNQGELRAPRAVLSAGSWSPLLSKALGFRLPIQPGKGYSVTMARPDNCPLHCMVLKERSVAVTPWPSGYRLGSTMEFVGYDTSLNPQRLQALIEGAAAFMHTPTSSGPHEPWYGWRPMTVDTVPIIDRAPKHKHLWLATGHSMLGVSMSPATGLLLAELMQGKKPHIDPKPYRYDRF